MICCASSRFLSFKAGKAVVATVPFRTSAASACEMTSKRSLMLPSAHSTGSTSGRFVLASIGMKPMAEVSWGAEADGPALVREEAGCRDESRDVEDVVDTGEGSVPERLLVEEEVGGDGGAWGFEA